MDGIQLFWSSQRQGRLSIHHLTAMPESEVAPPPPRPSKRTRRFQEARAPVVPPPPFLPNEVILEQILPRVPAADTVRLRAVCREWRAAVTSDHFVRAHRQAVVRAAAAARSSPEIVFFAPTASAGSPTTTSFYSSRLLTSTAQENNGSSSVREIVTVGDMRADDFVLSGTKPCRGLTLLFQPSVSAYHVCNLSTGEHVSLPRCPWARRVTADGPYVLSSTGLGFDPAADEHKVVRLFEDWNKQQHCEVYGLRSGGWRPCAGDVPMHAAKGLRSRPPVFVDGYFYWHMNTEMNFAGPEARLFRTPEPILSLAVDTEQFRWIQAPEERARYAFHLAELDGALCVVVDTRLTAGQYELWTLKGAADAGSTSSPSPSPSPSPWLLRCRISLASLPQPMRNAMRAGFRMLPLGSSSPGGEILLATSRHEVYTYDPESNHANRAFSATDFIDTLTRESEVLLNVTMHEEWVTPLCRRPGAGDDAGKLKMKLGNRIVARQPVQFSFLDSAEIVTILGSFTVVNLAF